MESRLWEEIEAALETSALDEEMQRYVRASFVAKEALDAAIADGADPHVPDLEAESSSAPRGSSSASALTAVGFDAAPRVPDPGLPFAFRLR